MAQYSLSKPLGYAQLTTTLSGAVSLPSIPAGTAGVLLVPSVQAVRFRDDGVAPSASVGMLLAVGQPPFFYFGKVTAIQVIAAAGGAVLDIAYYGG